MIIFLQVKPECVVAIYDCLVVADKTQRKQILEPTAFQKELFPQCQALVDLLSCVGGRGEKVGECRDGDWIGGLSDCHKSLCQTILPRSVVMLA